MNEYRITDGKTIIIEMAATESLARKAAAQRLGCGTETIQILEHKKRKLTKREIARQSYDEKYADYLLRIQRRTEKKCPGSGN